MGDIKFEKIKELDAPTIDILSKDPDKTYMFLAYDFERPAVKSTFHLFKFRFQIPYQEKWIIKIRHGYSFFLSDPNVLATNYDITSRAFADMIMRFFTLFRRFLHELTFIKFSAERRCLVFPGGLRPVGQTN